MILSVRLGRHLVVGQLTSCYMSVVRRLMGVTVFFVSCFLEFCIKLYTLLTKILNLIDGYLTIVR